EEAPMPCQPWPIWPRRERKLPSFTQNGDTLLKAKEAAASEALRTLFRTLNTRLSNSNNKELAKYLASLFEDAVELVQLRLKGDPEERSPGNVLYSLAYLAREPYALTPEKRMLTASHVKTLPEGGYQVFIQQKQR
ncbi:HMMR_C domain-containing protein, partial [Durusdinium trenchii]